jgi:tyrosyl-tRNA synthetase
MSAVKVAIQRIFTTCNSSGWDENPIQKKRRKTLQSTSSSNCCDNSMMDVDRNHLDSNNILPSSPPYVTISHMLAEKGLPSRFDPMSVDHFMYFEIDGTISVDLMAAIQHGDTDQLHRVLLGKDIQSSLFFLDDHHGRNPLHTDAWR